MTRALRAGLTLVPFLVASVAQAQSRRPGPAEKVVLVELFTSQG